jgi:hypothetical protein
LGITISVMVAVDSLTFFGFILWIVFVVIEVTKAGCEKIPPRLKS